MPAAAFGGQAEFAGVGRVLVEVTVHPVRDLAAGRGAREEADLEQVRVQMARWLDDERGRLAGGRGNVVRLQKAEGIGAYMRAHEFRMDQLVEALLKHSGASGVEIAAVHLVREGGNSTFQLKVMLPGETIGIGGQGFNVAFGSPDMTYTGVVYALALALYEVHEIINSESADGAEPPSDLDLESLPPPAPIDSLEGGAAANLTTATATNEAARRIRPLVNRSRP